MLYSIGRFIMMTLSVYYKRLKENQSSNQEKSYLSTYPNRTETLIIVWAD